MPANTILIQGSKGKSGSSEDRTPIAADDDNKLLTTGRETVVSATFARPANTTAYVAGDVICDSTSAPTVLTFSSCARTVAGLGTVTKAYLRSDGANSGDITLYLFNTAPVIDNDNSAWTPTWAEINGAKLVSTISFEAANAKADAGTTVWSIKSAEVTEQFACASGDTNLYGILVADGALTPASGQNFEVVLNIFQN